MLYIVHGHKNARVTSKMGWNCGNVRHSTMKPTTRAFVFAILLHSSAVAEAVLPLSRNYVSLQSTSVGESINITSRSSGTGSWVDARTSAECASKCSMNPQCTIFRFQGPDKNEGTPLCRTGPNLGSSAELQDGRWDTFLEAELTAGQECLASRQCGEPFRSPLPMTCDTATQRCTCFNPSSFERPATTSSDLKTCIPGSGPNNRGFRHLWDGFSYIRLPQPSGVLNRSQAQTACHDVNATLPEPSPTNDVNFQTLAAFMGPNDVFHLGYSVTEELSGRRYFSDSTNASVALESSSVWPTFSILGPSGNQRSVLMSQTGLQVGPDGAQVTCVICWRRPGYSSFLGLTDGMYYKMYMENKTYVGAENVCKSDGGRLAVTNKGYGVILMRHFQIVSGIEEFWVGGTDADEEGTWVFPDGTMYKLSDPAGLERNWYSRQPNGGTYSNCFRPVSAAALWADTSCGRTFPAFLCERIQL